MRRRRFDHLYVEISVAAGRRVPRYPLWLRIREAGSDPETLSCEAALEFCDRALDDFLAECGLELSPRAARRLRSAVARYDPSRREPHEYLAPVKRT